MLLLLLLLLLVLSLLLLQSVMASQTMHCLRAWAPGLTAAVM
jgi:hypothetical protein